MDDDLRGKVRYLQGLAEGLKLSEKDDTGQMLTKVIDVLVDICGKIEEMASSIKSVKAEQAVAEDQWDLLFDDVADLDNTVYTLIRHAVTGESIPFDLKLSDFFYGDNSRDQIESDELMEYRADDEIEDDLYEVVCPKCNKVYYADFEAFDEDNVVCPHCSTPYHLSEEIVSKLIEDNGEHDE